MTTFVSRLDYSEEFRVYFESQKKPGYVPVSCQSVVWVLVLFCFAFFVCFVCEYVEVREQLARVVSLSIMWDLGIESRSSGLAVSAFTH